MAARRKDRRSLGVLLPCHLSAVLPRATATDAASRPMTEDHAGIGARIRTLRQRRGWTLEKLAVELDLTNGYVSMLERGRRRPSVKTLQRLAEVFDVPVASLVGDEPTLTSAAHPSLGRISTVLENPELDDASRAALVDLLDRLASFAEARAPLNP
jgi:transcriptional regulator with XRE-family HTH domain